MNTSATFMRLLDTVSDHLHTVPLPAGIFSITVNHDVYGRERAVVQLGVNNLTQLASALMAWAHTLTEVTVEAWRVPRGGTVHLTVHGHLPNGLAIAVYDGVDHTEHLATLGLQPGDKRPIPLTRLREWANHGKGGAAA